MRQLLLFSGVLMIIALFIIPINSTVLDALIALNILLSVLVLLVCLTTNSLVQFSVFPTILLIATLARLSITISSTRLILAEADGGSIITTFGSFVTKGNIAVGFIIFIIVTIVNFVVITKGGERIGEVSSRFFLDAMPGKQVSIDSDLRSGLLTEQQAKERRNNLDKEAQLFGSLDGTMKFVKGDAIAGLIIIVINIIGGIIVGTLQHGYSAKEAASVFTTLTIGDGLVSQLPALLLSIGSAVLVSRVMDADEEEKSKLETQLSEQLFRNRYVLYASGIFCFLLALVPGMPSILFVGFSGGLLLYGYYGIKNTSVTLNKDLSHSLKQFLIGIPVSGKVSNLEAELVNTLELAIYEELGVGFTSVKVMNSADYSLNYYGVGVECPVSKGYKYELSQQIENGRGEEGVFFLGRSAYKTTTNESDECIGDDEMFVLWLKHIIKQLIRENFGIDETSSLLNLGDVLCPNLTKEVTEEISTSEINAIFMRLLAEGVYLYNVKDILTAFYQWCKKEKDELLLTELIRISLSTRIVKPHLSDNNVLNVVEIDQAYVDAIETSIRYDNAGSYIDMDTSLQEKLRSSVAELVPDSQRVVILCNADVRRYCWSIINNGRGFYDQITVISPLEVPRSITLNVKGVVRFETK